MLIEGQSEYKFGEFAGHASCRYLASVQLDHRLDEVKPHARALDVVAAGFVDLVEALEYLVYLLTRDAAAAVADLDYDLLGVGF